MEKRIITLRCRETDRYIFEAFCNGKKKVETRAATSRYQSIKAGDILRLVCGKDKFERRIKKVKVFKTVGTLLKKYKVSEINPKVKSAKELEAMFYGFSGYREKIKKYGLVALELK